MIYGRQEADLHFHIDELEQGEVKIKLATLSRVTPFFRGYTKSILFAVFAVLFTTVIAASLPLVFRWLVDEAIPAKDMNLILAIGLIYLGLLVLQGAFQYFQSLIVGYMGIEIVNDIKRKMLKHILKLSVRFFDGIGTGKLISRIESDSQKLFMLFSQVGLMMLWAVLNLIVSFGIMTWVNWRLTLLVFTILPVYSLGAFLFFKKMRPMFRKERSLYATITGFLNEHLKAIPVLRGLNNLDWSRDKCFRVNEDKRKYDFKIQIIESAVFYILLLTPQIIVGVIFYKSISGLQLGLITVGTVIMFVQYIEQAMEPLFMISEQVAELQRAFSSADRIFEILDTEQEVTDCVIPVEKWGFDKVIAFENVGFSYEKDKPVLKDVSFTIEKGSIVAIVGATGSGKTTIISLLTRFYDPQQGRITIDGQDIRSFKQNDLRKKISLVLQDIFLFPGDLLDNLRVLRKDIPEEKAMEASKKMGIEGFIKKLPKGYKTELAEEGANLSFGERQLLSFSRALTFDPEILIMDEATSSVDPYTEAMVQKCMSALMEDRTSIVIAHRLSTIEHADKILVMSRGKLVEEGHHRELLKKNGIYADLYRTQMCTGVRDA